MAEGFFDRRGGGSNNTNNNLIQLGGRGGTRTTSAFLDVLSRQKKTNKSKALDAMLSPLSTISNDNPKTNPSIVSSGKKDKLPPKLKPGSSFSVGRPDTLQAQVQQKAVTIIDRAGNQLKTIQPDSFTKDGKIVLNGTYKVNTISFDRFSFSEIKAFNTVSFQFILKIVDNSGTKYFTSSDFKGKLQTSNKRNEPYLALQSLAPESVVVVDLRQSLNGLDEQKLLEQKEGVNVTYNTYVDTNGTIDYQKLVEYINWVVSKPPQEYDDRIIRAEDLGSWDIINAGEEDTSEGNAEPSGTPTPTPAPTPTPTPIPPPPPIPAYSDPDPLPLGRYKPIGRAGNYIGEIVDRPEGNYRWDGDMWSVVVYGPSGGVGNVELPGGGDLGPNGEVGGSGNPSGGGTGGNRNREMLL